MNSFKEGWYLIYTKPRHEKKVHTRLKELCIHSFLPLKKNFQTRQGKKTVVDQPLFPSYIFIYLESMQHYYCGMDMEGALYYVKTGKEIARIHESIVESVKLAVNQAKEYEISEQRFLPGRRLVITQGPLTGLSCEVVQLDRKQKLLVRVDLLQRNILINLPEDYLMAI